MTETQHPHHPEGFCTLASCDYPKTLTGRLLAKARGEEVPALTGLQELQGLLEPTAQAQAYETESYRDFRNERHATFRKGLRLVTAHEQADGRLRMVAFLDYGGQDGLNHCDSKTYKTAAGAARFTKGFLK